MRRAWLVLLGAALLAAAVAGVFALTSRSQPGVALVPGISDPVQAGVMAVMAVADTATFTVNRLKRRVF